MRPVRGDVPTTRCPFYEHNGQERTTGSRTRNTGYLLRSFSSSRRGRKYATARYYRTWIFSNCCLLVVGVATCSKLSHGIFKYRRWILRSSISRIVGWLVQNSIKRLCMLNFYKTVNCLICASRNIFHFFKFQGRSPYSKIFISCWTRILR